MLLRYVAVYIFLGGGCLGLHLRECLGEAAAISCDLFTLVSEWELSPGMVVGVLAVEIDDVLLTRCASDGAIRLLGEHGVILVLVLAGALPQHFHDLSDLLADLRELSERLLLVGELPHELLDGLLQFAHDADFEVQQISLVSPQGHLLIQELKLAIGLISVLLKFRSKP